MAIRIYTDPKLRDWVIVAGSNKRDAGYTSRARWLLSLRKGSAAAYPALGAEYYKLTKQVANLGERLVKYTKEALQPMLDDKSLTAVTAQVASTLGDLWTVKVTLHVGGTNYSFEQGVLVGGAY